MTTWLLALTGPATLALAALAAVDLLHRRDLGWGGRVAWVVGGVLAPAFAAVAYVLTRPVGVEAAPGAGTGTGAGAGARAATGTGAPLAAGTGARSAVRSAGGGGGGLVAPTARGAGAARGPRERTVQRLARAAVRGLFASVEVIHTTTEREDPPPAAPQLWVASHFGALSDPIVLLHALPRPPRFLAAAGLFRVPVLRWVLRGAGAIPVLRTQDGGGAANEAAFASAWRALAAGDPVAIFPEGIANDTSRLAPLRTGAARIALGSAAAGLRVVPVGIHYQDKAGLRRRVLVDVGEALDVAAWRDRYVSAASASRPAGERAMVRALTEELERRLHEVAPTFADATEQHALLAAAGIALRTPDGPASFGARADLADALAERPAAVRDALVSAVATFQDELDAAGLDDAAIVRRGRRSSRNALLTLLVGALLLPPAVLGAVVHAPLALVVWATGRLRVAPVTAATIRPAVAVVGAVITWSSVGWWAARVGIVGGPVEAVALGLVVLPLWGLAALVVLERVLLVVSALRRRAATVVRPRRRRRGGGDVLTPLRVERQRIVDLVRTDPRADDAGI